MDRRMYSDKSNSLLPETPQSRSESLAVFDGRWATASEELPPHITNFSLHRPLPAHSSEIAALPHSTYVSPPSTSVTQSGRFLVPECNAAPRYHILPNGLRCAGGADGHAQQSSHARRYSALTPHLFVANLNLSRISIVSLDLASAGVAAAPLLLRGTVSGTRLRFATELAWPIPEPSRQGTTCWGAKDVPASSWSVAWPSFSLTDTIEAPCVLQGGSVVLPKLILVLECYVGAYTKGLITCTMPQPTEQYVGRCEIPLGDVAISERSPDVGQPNPVEVVLRDRFGSSRGCVRFCAVLQALLQRTVRLRNVELLQGDSPIEQTPSSHHRNAAPFLSDGEVVLTLVNPRCASEGKREGSVVAAAAADIRTTAAVRWSVLPSVSFYDTLDTVSSPSFSPSSLLLGYFHYTESMQDVCTQSHGWSPSGAERQHRQILLGTIAIPTPPLHPSHSSQGDYDFALRQRREELISAQSVPFRYNFAMPLRVSEGGSQLMVMKHCWVRGIAETWTAPQRVLQTGGEVVGGGADSRRDPLPTRGSALATGTVQTANTVRAGLHGRFLANPQDSSAGVAVLRAERGSDEVKKVGGEGQQKDGVFEGVRRRQAALIHRIEQRLSSVQRQRHDLQGEIVSQADHARREENAIAEEYNLLNSQLMKAQVAYQETADELLELQRRTMFMDRSSDKP